MLKSGEGNEVLQFLADAASVSTEKSIPHTEILEKRREVGGGYFSIGGSLARLDDACGDQARDVQSLWPETIRTAP